jgi:hypothetical protein
MVEVSETILIITVVISRLILLSILLLGMRSLKHVLSDLFNGINSEFSELGGSLSMYEYFIDYVAHLPRILLVRRLTSEQRQPFIALPLHIGSLKQVADPLSRDSFLEHRVASLFSCAVACLTHTLLVSVRVVEGIREIHDLRACPLVLGRLLLLLFIENESLACRSFHHLIII